jgi:septum site-determining protein MinC
VPDTVPSLRSMRICGRSYIAYVLTPEVPVFDFLSNLDIWTRRSAGFFAGRPVVLDLSAVVLSKNAVAQLVTELQARGIRIMGIEGVSQADIGPELPPVLKGGRTTTVVEPVAPQTQTQEMPARPVPSPEPTSLLLESPVRSGQSVVFAGGDVTVLGSVASGAEIIAGGSIHVYGALRGRALAGSNGNPRARIFCNKLEAELLAIDGFYRGAEEMEPDLRGRPTQAWLQDEMLFVAQVS